MTTEQPTYPKVQGTIRITLNNVCTTQILTLPQARLLVNRLLGALNRAGQTKVQPK